MAKELKDYCRNHPYYVITRLQKDPHFNVDVNVFFDGNKWTDDITPSCLHDGEDIAKSALKTFKKTFDLTGATVNLVHTRMGSSDHLYR